MRTSSPPPNFVHSKLKLPQFGGGASKPIVPLNQIRIWHCSQTRLENVDFIFITSSFILAYLNNVFFDTQKEITKIQYFYSFSSFTNWILKYLQYIWHPLWQNMTVTIYHILLSIMFLKFDTRLKCCGHQKSFNNLHRDRRQAILPGK